MTEAMRRCLSYYRDNESNPDRRQRPPYTWTTRQVNKALERGWLKVGPGGWHILSEAGSSALQAKARHISDQDDCQPRLAPDGKRFIHAADCAFAKKHGLLREIADNTNRDDLTDFLSNAEDRKQ